MSLLIALHSPAIGYCTNSDAYFVGGHAQSVEVCDHGCDDHSTPEDHEHLMVSIDPGNFQWSANPLCIVPQFIVMEWPGWSLPSLFIDEELRGNFLSSTNPPPPDLPIFRRDSALRI
ncbi:hypothetical protein V2O64_07060 [Verrucomicrobiaceae bacterium 227]